MRISMLAAVAFGLLWPWTAFGDAASPPSGQRHPTTAAANRKALDRLPEAVRKTAIKEAGNHRIHGIEKESKGGKPAYAVEWMEGKKEVEIWIAEDGTVLDRKSKEIVPQPRPKTRRELRDDMKALLGLSDEQVARIAALDTALDKAAAKWRADNAGKVRQARRALFTSRNKQALVKAILKLRELQAPYDEIVAKAAADVQGVLSAAQQATWQEHAVIDLSINVWFARAKLTDAQRTAVRSAYAKLAKAKDARLEAIQVALAQKVRDMLSDRQLKALGPFLMQTEWSFHMSTSRPASVQTGPPAKPRASASAGQLNLPVPKLLKNGVLVIFGGYGGIIGPRGGGGNTIVSTERD